MLCGCGLLLVLRYPALVSISAGVFYQLSFLHWRTCFLSTARRYTVRLEADKATCPVLLSNGQCEESGDLPNGW